MTNEHFKNKYLKYKNKYYDLVNKKYSLKNNRHKITGGTALEITLWFYWNFINHFYNNVYYLL